MLFILRPDNDVLRNLIHTLGELPPKEWEVSIKPHVKNKTRQQERYFHAIIDLICDFNGDSKEDMKRRITWNCGLKEEFVTDDGEVKVFPKGTSGLNVAEYSLIIDAAQSVCNALGLRYPEPLYFGLGL